MTKRNLAELVDQAVADKPEAAPDPGTPVVPNLRSSENAKFGTQEAAKSVPRYLQLVRKDTRLRDDQLAALTGLARQLSRRRQPNSERITENTLIRVAVDLLLDQADRLDGATESELRQSIAEPG